MAKHVFNVKMTCGGCSGAVERVLKKLQGVNNIAIDMDAQKVTVDSDLDKDKLLETIAKTGKECSYAGSE
eukprot:m.228347 g.228347  ORF g.228347 m.228347 type:complete len:70 (+) comp17452_c0_seq1:124-333(+)